MQLENIGKWKIFALESGNFRLDGGAMMGSVPKVLWEKTNPSDQKNRIKLSLRRMVIDDGKRRILIETGLGNKFDNKFCEMFNITQNDNPLINSLHVCGYKEADITDVILTHLHFDHAGGATIYNEEHELIPTFSNATYHISKSNWELGLDPNPRDSASYYQ